MHLKYALSFCGLKEDCLLDILAGQYNENWEPFKCFQIEEIVKDMCVFNCFVKDRLTLNARKKAVAFFHVGGRTVTVEININIRSIPEIALFLQAWFMIPLKQSIDWCTRSTGELFKLIAENFSLCRLASIDVSPQRPRQPAVWYTTRILRWVQ